MEEEQGSLQPPIEQLRSAFVCFLETHWEELHKYSRAHLWNAPDAEDNLVQGCLKAFRALYRAAPDVHASLLNPRSQGRFRGWLYTILSRNAIDWLRQQHRSPSVPLPSIELDSERPARDIADPRLAPEQQVLAHENEQLVHELHQKLSGRQSECIQLHYFADRTRNEIAAILGIGEETVKDHLSEALWNMRVQLIRRWRAGELPEVILSDQEQVLVENAGSNDRLVWTIIKHKLEAAIRGTRSLGGIR